MIIFKTQNILFRFIRKRVRVTGVQIPTPTRQQGRPLVHCDGFSSHNMGLISSIFGKSWRVIPSPPTPEPEPLLLWWFKKRPTSNLDLSWKKLGFQGSKFQLLLWVFSTTFLNFSKLISSQKAQVCSIWKNYLGNQIFLLHNKHFVKLYHSQNVFTQIWYLHK